MSCEVKKKFDSIHQAESFMKNVVGKVKNHRIQHAYICPFCHWIHLTSDVNQERPLNRSKPSANKHHPHY